MKHVPGHAVAPRPTPASEGFWSSCDEGRLSLPKCERCETIFYYPRLACPSCGSRELRWIDASGRGTIFSHTTVHTSFYGAEWEDDIPYTVLLVDLEEGPRMLSRLVGDDTGLRTGAAVTTEFFRIGERRYPMFRLDQET